MFWRIVPPKTPRFPRRRKIHPTKSSPPKKDWSEQVFLNKFCSVAGSCRRKAGRSLRELFEKVRANAFFFGGGGGYFWILDGLFSQRNVIIFLRV